MSKLFSFSFKKRTPYRDAAYAQHIQPLRQLQRIRRFSTYYNIFEVAFRPESSLPAAPDTKEKYAYLKRNSHFLLWCSVLSFGAISLSTFQFFLANPLMWPFFIVFTITIIYFLISLGVNASTKEFDYALHYHLITSWRPASYPSVDVFLPTAGEPLDVLANTWNGIKDMTTAYKGAVTVYCLDDSGRKQVAELARRYGFVYKCRPNRPEYKKAGNLRYGFEASKNPFIAIFDADFKPRPDFLAELLPYFYHNPKVGIVQSPQYFGVTSEQGWLERGAGAVQELFYRFSQVSRQHHDASICVGSNALYRRKALNDTGGTALIEHSEDVHTGFNLRMYGWTIQYIPIILAKGLCPAGMNAFFKQQYRWCLGSMSLMTSRKFWCTRLRLRTRLSYFSGFLYYITTAIGSVYMPLIPLALLLFFSDQIELQNYVLILPAFIFTQILYPMWHHASYGIEAWSTRSVYGWAHLFAVHDTITGNAMSWQPTGSKMSGDRRYLLFRTLQFCCNTIPGMLWILLASWRGISMHTFAFAPMVISGMYYVAICAKVSFYHERRIRSFAFGKTKLPEAVNQQV